MKDPEKKYNNNLNRDMVRNFSISLDNSHWMVVKYDLPTIICC